MTNWRLQAACRGCEPNMWFPARGDMRTLAEAKAVCRFCSVRDECLAEAMQTPIVKEGVWGGLTEYERRKLRRARSVA